MEVTLWYGELDHLLPGAYSPGLNIQSRFSDDNPVFAIADGVISHVSGNRVYMDLRLNGVTSRVVYENITHSGLSAGDAVRRGQTLGEMGRQNITIGDAAINYTVIDYALMELEIRKAGETVNPAKFFNLSRMPSEFLHQPMASFFMRHAGVAPMLDGSCYHTNYAHNLGLADEEMYLRRNVEWLFNLQNMANAGYEFADAFIYCPYEDTFTVSFFGETTVYRVQATSAGLTLGNVGESLIQPFAIAHVYLASRNARATDRFGNYYYADFITTPSIYRDFELALSWRKDENGFLIPGDFDFDGIHHYNIPLYRFAEIHGFTPLTIPVVARRQIDARGGYIQVITYVHRRSSPRCILIQMGIDNPTAVQESAIRKISSYRASNDHVMNRIREGGVTIFAFEGAGTYSGIAARPNLHPNGRFGAMIVAMRGDEFIFVTENASTLPDSLTISDARFPITTQHGVSTPMDGVYAFAGWAHQGIYAALQLRQVSTQLDGIPVFRAGNSCLHRISGTGINVHGAGTNTGATTSLGCMLIEFREYPAFLMALDFGTNAQAAIDTPPATYMLMRGTIGSRHDPSFRGIFVINRDLMPVECRNNIWGGLKLEACNYCRR